MSRYVIEVVGGYLILSIVLCLLLGGKRKPYENGLAVAVIGAMLALAPGLAWHYYGGMIWLVCLIVASALIPGGLIWAWVDRTKPRVNA